MSKEIQTTSTPAPDLSLVGSRYRQDVIDLFDRWGSVRVRNATLRGYVEMKNRKADECISIAEKHIPNLREAIDHIYTSTPLSYYSYTNTENGSAYGIRKDFESPMTTVLTPKTPIKNLLLTGQNLNLHGVLGVSMTALFTVKEILNGKIRDLVTY